MVSATMASLAPSALLEGAGAIAFAADNRNFRDGLRALAEGDPDTAYNAFFGQTGEEGFYGDLVDKGFPRAALLFRDRYLVWRPPSGSEERLSRVALGGRVDRYAKRWAESYRTISVGR
jgi:hypothetical protein